MNFIRRAWLTLTAKKGRTGLLTLVFTAILVFVLAGLTIQSAAINATETAKKSVGATVSLSVNRQAMMQERRSSSSTTKKTFTMPAVPLTSAEKIAKLDGVKSYSFTATTAVNAKSGITAITSTESTATSSSETSRGGFGGGPAKETRAPSGDFQVVGTNDLSGVTDFTDGTSKITSGRAITSADKGTNNIVIEKDLATENSLKVGSTFKVASTATTVKNYTFKVVGIYTTTTSGDSMMNQFSFMNPANQMYGYLSLVSTLKATSTTTVDSAVYNLKDPATMASFVKNAKKQVDTTKYQVTSNDATYQTMLTPLNNVASFAKNVVILVAIAGAIILTLIIVLTIRDRKFEIGVLLSLGEGKAKVIGQFFTELFIVMIVAVGLSSVTGNFVGNAIGQQLLTQQNTAQTTAASNTSTEGGPGQGGPGGGVAREPGGRGGFGVVSKSEAKQIDKLNVKSSPQEIGYLGLIALGIVLIAILVASIGILRLQPKAILTGN
jgi:putative ABC transport system permease protein